MSTAGRDFVILFTRIQFFVAAQAGQLKQHVSSYESLWLSKTGDKVLRQERRFRGPTTTFRSLP